MVATIAPRRDVAATTPAASTRAPQLFSARAASASVAPVVTTSSARSTARARSSGSRAEATTRSAPPRLAARCIADSPAWSRTRRPWRRAGRSVASTPARRKAATPYLTTRRVGSSPRARRDAPDEGTGTTTHGPDPPDTASCAATSAALSAAPNDPARARRPRSLWANRSARTTPSYAADAHTGGRPGGAGLGVTRTAARRRAAKQTAQAGSALISARPQPGQILGHTRSTTSRNTTEAWCLQKPRTGSRLPMWTAAGHLVAALCRSGAAQNPGCVVSRAGSGGH